MLGTDLPTAWSSNDGEELASPPSLVKKKQKTGNKGNHAWDLYIITVQTNKPTNSSSGEINPPGSSINTSATSANMIFFFPPLRLKIKGGLYLRGILLLIKLNLLDENQEGGDFAGRSQGDSFLVADGHKGQNDLLVHSSRQCAVLCCWTPLM